MDGKKLKVKEKLKVHRDFECSRLEKDLLAGAYERVLPQVRVVFSVAEARSPVAADDLRAGSARGMDSNRPIAIGGRIS